MPNRYLVRVEIDEDRLPEGAKGVLLPVPPTTPDQRVGRLTLDPAWTAEPCCSQDGVQAGLFATFPGRSLRNPMELEFSLGIGDLIEEHFAAKRAGSMEPGPDARQLYADLCCDEVGSEDARLLRIVDCIAEKFEYRHGFHSDEPLTCDVLTGNCLDINTALIKMLRLCGIKSAYYIGYFFEQGRPWTNDDWHCWVSTLTGRGYESWDVAHHLKRDLGRVAPALNPIPGVRFAMSTGRDLVFNLPFATLEVPHLCEPRWIYADGRSRECRVRVTVDPAAWQAPDTRGAESMASNDV
jgi:hypothetical protein